MGNQKETKAQNARREFLAQVGMGLALAIPLTQVLLRKKAFAGTEMADENDPIAKSVGYSCPASKVDTTKWPKRAGDEGAKQYCWNCALYQAKDPKNPDADAMAPCPLFAMKNVKMDCWCNSWTLNPNVKT